MNYMIKICLWCKKEFHVYPSREKTAFTCSKKCAAFYRNSFIEKPITICAHCGKEFYRPPSLCVGKKVYCSVKCHNIGRLVHVYECELCKTVFHRPVRKNQIVRFCSKICMYATLKIERNPITSYCKVCKKPIHKSNSAILNGQGKFCSLKCRDTYFTGKGKNGVGEAQYPHYYSRPDWKQIRKKVIEQDNYTCQDCGLKPEQHSRLQVHHKERRTLGGTDDLNNLITLCFSCHKRLDGRLY